VAVSVTALNLADIEPAASRATTCFPNPAAFTPSATSSGAGIVAVSQPSSIAHRCISPGTAEIEPRAAASAPPRCGRAKPLYARLILREPALLLPATASSSACFPVVTIGASGGRYRRAPLRGGSNVAQPARRAGRSDRPAASPCWCASRFRRQGGPGGATEMAASAIDRAPPGRPCELPLASPWFVDRAWFQAGATACRIRCARSTPASAAGRVRARATRQPPTDMPHFLLDPARRLERVVVEGRNRATARHAVVMREDEEHARRPSSVPLSKPGWPSRSGRTAGPGRVAAPGTHLLEILLAKKHLVRISRSWMFHHRDGKAAQPVGRAAAGAFQAISSCGPAFRASTPFPARIPGPHTRHPAAKATAGDPVGRRAAKTSIKFGVRPFPDMLECI